MVSVRRRVRLGRVAAAAFAAAVVAGATLASVSGGGGRLVAPRSGVVLAVAAENFWGSILGQLGGVHVSVTSIITNPNTDPHSYEPEPGDARTLAEAALVVVNGVGYDPWAEKLLGADGSSPSVLDVGGLLGLHDGDNPHRWYNPTDVERVVSAMVADLDRIEPAYRSYFSARARLFESVSLAPYHRLVAQIRRRFAGTPVGASESIFSMLAPSLGLDLITPYSFLKDVSEGSEVSAADKETIDAQIREHRIKIYVYNSQNATPDIAAQLAECRAARIPTTSITETLSPASASYQAWQTRQLEGILKALERASPR